MKRPLVYIFLLVSLALLAWIGRSIWLPLPGQWLLETDGLEPADALVALVGETERLVYGAELFKSGFADTFVVTTVSLNLPGIDEPYFELARREVVERGVAADRVYTIRQPVRTTVEEIEALRLAAEQTGWGSILIVTSPYHTRRAGWIADDVFEDSPIIYRIVSIEDHWYRPDQWWRDEISIRETWSEYAKLALYLSGYQN